jgi:hypothetical protein
VSNKTSDTVAYFLLKFGDNQGNATATVEFSVKETAFVQGLKKIGGVALAVAIIIPTCVCLGLVGIIICIIVIIVKCATSGSSTKHAHDYHKHNQQPYSQPYTTYSNNPPPHYAPPTAYTEPVYSAPPQNANLLHNQV